MKRFLRRFLVILLIALGVIVGLSLLITTLFEDSLGRRVVAEVNKQLRTELRVAGFDLSVIRTFPNVGVNLQQVVVDDLWGEPLLETQTLSLRFGLFSLLTSNIKVRSVVVSDGALRVHYDQRGQANYDIFAEEEAVDSRAPAEEAGGPTFDIQQARLENIELIYEDEEAEQTALVQVDEATFSGQFSSTRFTMDSEASMQIALVDLAGTRYLAGQPLTYDATVDMNTAEGVYQLQSVQLRLGELPLQVSGQIQQWEESTFFELAFQSREGSLAAIWSLLPADYRENLAGLETSGDFQLTGTVDGDYAADRMPEIKVDLSFADGRVSSEKMDGDIRDVSFEASFTNGIGRNDRTSVFALENLKGYFQRELFEMRLEVQNLEDPRVDFAANGALAMGVLAGLIADERVQSGSGEVEIAQLRLKGRYEDMIDPRRISLVETGGALIFDDAQLMINGQRLLLDRGRVSLENNQLTVEDMKLDGPGTQIEFRGSAFNVLPVLFADSTNSRQAELEFSADLISEQLDIDQLLALTKPTAEQEAAAAATGQTDSLATAQVENRQEITKFLRGVFRANIKAFNYDEIQGQDFVGEVAFNTNEMLIKGRTLAMGGQFLLDGTMFLEKEPWIKAKVTCNDVDVSEFFRQAENFGQEVLQARHIDGQADAHLLIYSYFDSTGNILMDKLRVLASLDIREGSLKNFELLESFSTFVNIKDLRDIRFTHLQNYLEVRNRRLYLPVMFLQSNALNMTISGEHTFDNEIAYYIKVNAGQVLFDRFRRHDPTLKPKKARRSGFFNLYYAILGTLENYDVQTAKRMVRADFERSELRRRDIRDELQREFATAIHPIDEPLDWRDIPEYPENTDDPEFLDMEIEGGGTGRN